MKAAAQLMPGLPGTVKPLTWATVPFDKVVSDNSSVFFIKDFNCYHIQLLVNGQPLQIGYKGRFLFNPTQAFKGSSAKPEIHFTAPKSSDCYKGLVALNAMLPAIYKDNVKEWKDVQQDLKHSSIPKPGGPKDPELKKQAARARADHQTFVPPAGAACYDSKFSVAWPWTRPADGVSPAVINTNAKTGCVVKNKDGEIVHDALALFKNDKNEYQGAGWEALVVVRPYIWASHVTYRYGLRFKLKFLQIKSMASEGSNYDMSGVDPDTSMMLDTEY